MHLRILLLSSLFAIGDTKEIDKNDYMTYLVTPKLQELPEMEGYFYHEPSRNTVWDIGKDGDVLIKFHPPHACTHMQMCSVPDKDQTCAKATQASTIMVFPGLKEAKLFAGKQMSSEHWHSLVDTIIMSKKSKESTTNERDFFTLGHETEIQTISIPNGLLRIETPSFYCKVEVVQSYLVPKRYTFMKDAAHHYKFDFNKFDGNLDKDDLGPMFLPKGGAKIGEKRIPDFAQYWQIKLSESLEHVCPTVDEWLDFAQWGKYDREHGNLLTTKTFLKQSVLRYRVEKTDEGCTAHPRSFMIEFDNPKQLESEEYEICRGFSLCFQTTGTKTQGLCNDKKTTFEIYPDNMMIIGPDSPDARMLMETRDRMQYMRFWVKPAEKGTKVWIDYDLLNTEQPGSTEIFWMDKDVGDDFLVDVIRDGQCKMRLLSERHNDDSDPCLAVTQCTAYDITKQ